MNSPRSARIHGAIAIGVINWMDTQLISLLMFLLLTYLLFQRPASAASKRLPTELNFQIGHTVNLKSGILRKKSASLSSRSGLSRSSLRSVALGSALIPLLGVFATAQSPADAKDNAELLKEMRQMRQLIERLESRVNQLEAEKSAAAVKPALPAAQAPDAAAAALSATSTTGQTGALSEGDRKALDFFRGTTISGTVSASSQAVSVTRPTLRKIISIIRALTSSTTCRFTISDCAPNTRSTTSWR